MTINCAQEISSKGPFGLNDQTIEHNDYQGTCQLENINNTFTKYSVEIPVELIATIAYANHGFNTLQSFIPVRFQKFASYARLPAMICVPYFQQTLTAVGAAAHAVQFAKNKVQQIREVLDPINYIAL